MDALDQKLLALLTENSRRNITELSKQLGVTRATVQEHIRRLEHRRIIQGYTVRLHPDYLQRQISANVLIEADQKQLPAVSKAIEQLPAVRALYSISGQFDLSATVQGETTEALDREIDKIIAIKGVERTQTSVYLRRMFER